MESIGIDVHKSESQICVITPTGEVLEQRVATRREQFAEVLGERPRARVLIEASTESEWVLRDAWRSWGTRWWWRTRTSRRCTRPAPGR